jgi:hypothetical protein
MDGLGLSSNKSFLDFLNSRIMSSITTLGVSLSNDVAKRIENIKELEYNKLLEASKTKPKDKELWNSDNDSVSEKDSNIGLDHHGIQHLIGDIADDVFGEDGSTWSDFKPAPRKRKLVQTKRIEATKD